MVKLFNSCCDKQQFIQKYSSAKNTFQQKEMQSKWHQINSECNRMLILD